MNVTSLRSNTDQNSQSAEIRIAKVAMLNISLWLVMWTPYASIAMQGVWGNQATITPLVTIIPALMTKAASVSNPIIYAISHPKYRLVRLNAKFSKEHLLLITFFSSNFLGSAKRNALVLHQ